MKIGRNERCPCGSGKKYKHCCYLNAQATTSQMNNDFALELARNVSRATAMTSPSASEASTKPKAEAKATAPKQPAKKADAKTDAKKAAKTEAKASPKPATKPKSTKKSTATKATTASSALTIAEPNDVSASPVMCYLGLMFDEMLEDKGTIKATAKGNLPAKIVRDASELLSDFAVAHYKIASKDNDFSGSNEANFGALSYTRELAEAAGLMHFERGRFHAAEGVVAQYQNSGLTSFFPQLLTQAITSQDWSALNTTDSASAWNTVVDAVKATNTVSELSTTLNTTAEPLKAEIILGFLQRWGFVAIDPKAEDAALNVQPLLA